MRPHAGIFLVALSALATEITLVRLLSVITWYHLAFFAISTAMLGMTAGAITVYVRQPWFAGPKLMRSVALACIANALTTPVALVALNLLPLGFERFGFTTMSVAAFAFATALCALPFYWSGIAISALLTLANAAIGRLYAADLIGAATGCLLVLVGLAVFDAPSLILLCAALGGLAAYVFTARTSRTVGYAGLAAFCALVLLAWLNSGSPGGIRPLMVKETLVDSNKIQLERWNSHSQVVVDKPFVGPPQYWGGSAKAPQDPIPQFWMRIDGSAGTTVRRFSSFADIDHLRYDITNAGYYLRGSGGAFIVSVGGGRDLQSALLFGHEHVTGVDVNRIFIDLQRNEFAEFAGLANRPDVTLVADEARSYLARTDQRFSIIEMSLVDTWTATGAGAFSFTENALYTVEGWRIFLSRLKDDGILTVSRWHDPTNLGETGRALSLASATLLSFGVADPAQHVAMLTNGNLSTLIVGRQPLSSTDIDTLRRLAADMGFNIAVMPGQLPDNADLRAIVGAKSRTALDAAVSGMPLNYSAPTDDRPYFFNMLKLGNLAAAANAGAGVLRGNLTATITLLSLLAALAVLSALTVVLPLALKKTGARTPGSAALWPMASYFSLIGAGFMFTEIGLVQRLSVFLGHPIYALSVILFTVILSTGFGSYLSDFVRGRDRPPVRLALAAAGAIVAVQYALVGLLDLMTSSQMTARIVVCVAVIAPLGLLLGLFFPLGMRAAKELRFADTAWLWALNGVFGVLASVFAVLVSIHASISANFLIGAVCYALVAPAGLIGARAATAARLIPEPALAD